MSTRGRWIAAALAALALGVVAILVARSGVPLDEVTELAGEGGEKRLREPMRPPRAAARVLVLALDGVGADELRTLLHSAAAPELTALVGAEQGEGIYEQAYAVPGVLSVLPSTTFAAWASLFTGRPPAWTGVPGNEWFAREEARFYAPAPVSVTGAEHAARVYTDNLVGQVLRVPTLYERADVRSYVSLSAVHRGADLLTMPDPTVVAAMAGAAVEGLASEDAVAAEAYRELDRTAVESLLGSLREHGVPDLQVVYFPGVDLFTHTASPPLPEQREYLRQVVDPAVGRILGEYRRQGALRDTYVVIVSDHGHTPVLDDDRHALEAQGDDEPPAVLERLGFRVRPPVLDLGDDPHDYQAVLAYQGAIAYVYLADRTTCPRPGQRCDWSRPPRLEEDVLPVARAFHEASRTGARVPALLGTLDLVFARAPRATTEPALPFQVHDGRELIPVARYLERMPRPDLVDLERRLEGLGAGPLGHRAGDVLLLARSGMEIPIDQRFYFSGRYHSWHGSPSPQDSRVPVVVAHPGKGGAELRDMVDAVLGASPSQTDIVPLILALLGRVSPAPARPPR